MFQAPVCGGSFGGGIYVGGVIYVTCSDGIQALSLDTQAKTFAPLGSWHVTSGAIGPPIAAGGLIWSAGWHDGTLYATQPEPPATSRSRRTSGALTTSPRPAPAEVCCSSPTRTG